MSAPTVARTLLLLACLAPGLVQAQGAPIGAPGIVDFIDIDPAGRGTFQPDPGCFTTEPDPRACLPHVATIHMDAFDAWQRTRNPATRLVHAAPYESETVVDDAADALDDAWATFLDRALEELEATLNAAPPCFDAAAPCGAHVDTGCVRARQAQAIATILSTIQDAYWQDVAREIVTRLPHALWWESPFPDMGAVIQPVFTLAPTPAQYDALPTNAQERAYYFSTSGAGALGGGTTPQPGVPHLEDRKRGLERSTRQEQERFGHAVFFMIHGTRVETNFRPDLATICMTGPFPTPLAVPIPTRIPNVPRTVYTEESVPEGYAIPRISGAPRALPFTP